MHRVLISCFGFAASGLGVIALEYLYMWFGLRDATSSLESLACGSSSSSGCTPRSFKPKAQNIKMMTIFPWLMSKRWSLRRDIAAAIVARWPGVRTRYGERINDLEPRATDSTD